MCRESRPPTSWSSTSTSRETSDEVRYGGRVCESGRVDVVLIEGGDENPRECVWVWVCNC